MKWTINEEKAAKQEYLSMIDTLKTAEEFEHDWCGHWEDFEKEVFGRKKIKVKGDKAKFMKYWLEDQAIINYDNWNNITNEDNYEDEYF